MVFNNSLIISYMVIQFLPQSYYSVHITHTGRVHCAYPSQKHPPPTTTMSQQEQQELFYGVFFFFSSLAFFCYRSKQTQPLQGDTKDDSVLSSISVPIPAPDTSTKQEKTPSTKCESNFEIVDYQNGVTMKKEMNKQDKAMSSKVMDGKDAITTLLSQALHSSSPLSDPVLFYQWVMHNIHAKSSNSNEFQKRQALIELACQHEEEISAAECYESEALLAWHNHPMYPEFLSLTQRSEVIRKVLENMGKQFNRKLSEAKLASLRSNIQEKEAERDDLERQIEPLQLIPEYKDAVLATAKHVQLLDDLGISTAEQELETLQHDTGVQKSRSGFRFEDEASRIIQEKLLVKIAKEHQVPVESLIIVRNITFQMASFEGSPGEIDMLVCLRRGEGSLEEEKTQTPREVSESMEKKNDKSENRAKKSKTKNKTQEKSAVDVIVLAVIEVNSLCEYLSTKRMSI